MELKFFYLTRRFRDLSRDNFMILQKHIFQGFFQALCSLLFCPFSSSWVCSVLRKLPLQVQTEPVEQQTH